MRASGRLSNAMKESVTKTLIPVELILPPVLEIVIVVCKDFSLEIRTNVDAKKI